MGRKVFVCLSQLKIGVINSRMNGTGIIFPIMQIHSALVILMFSTDAASRPPLSSRIGTMEMMKTIISRDTWPLSAEITHDIIDSIIFYLMYSFKNS